MKPDEILNATINAGVAKSQRSFKSLVLLGILAGADIAFAGMASSMASFNLTANPETFGLGKALSGTVFSAGLVMVVQAGGELFTGNSLIFASVLDGKTKVSMMLRNWVIVYVSNFIGGALVTYLAVQTGMFNSGAGMLGAVSISVAANKVNMAFMPALFSGILCNWLVSLAVWMSTGADSTIGKIFAMFFPIWAFVISGFEHCIANMFFIPAGIMLKANETLVELSGVTAEKLANLTWSGMAINNLIPVTIGNIIGGAVCVAAMYWMAVKKK